MGKSFVLLRLLHVGVEQQKVEAEEVVEWRRSQFNSDGAPEDGSVAKSGMGARIEVLKR
jgi:hypothetical protein